MKNKIKLLLSFFIVIMSLLTFTSCKLENENCEDINYLEIITLTKKNKISSNGQSLSVKATVSPSYIQDKKVNWSLSWDSSYSFSGWYGGAPDVNKYVGLSVSSDTLTCTVSIKQELPCRVILTCTANSNANIKKTCNIDYVSRNFSPHSDALWAKDAIDGVDLSYEQLFESALDEISTVSTSSSNIYNQLSGTVKNITIDYEGEIETYDGYMFYISDSSMPICEDYENYDSIMSTEGLYVPIYYDVYYGSTLIESNCWSWLEVCFA